MRQDHQVNHTRPLRTRTHKVRMSYRSLATN
jgi:hypothetical protein